MPKLNEIIGEDAFKALPEDTRKKYKDTDFVNSTDYVPKERFTQVNDEKNEYKKQVGERDKQLLGLQDKVKDNDNLTKEIETLKTANSTTAADYEKKLQQIKFDTAIDNALKDSNSKDPKIIKALLDTDKLKVSDDGQVIGLKEQMEVLQKDKDYLFEKEIKGTGTFRTGSKTKEAGTEEKSLGERLAEEKSAQQKNSEAASKFFK